MDRLVVPRRRFAAARGSRGVSCSVIGLAAAALLFAGCASQSGDDDDSASAGTGGLAPIGTGGQLGSGGMIASGTGGLGSGGSGFMPTGSGGGMEPMMPIGTGGVGSAGMGAGGAGGATGSGGAVAMMDAGVAGAGTGGMNAGSGGSGSGGANGGMNSGATFTASYAIMSAKCGGGLTGCHVTGSSGMLRMPDKATAYTNLVGVAGSECKGETRVIAGDADGSLLVKSVEGTACVDRMPRNRDPLSATEIKTIRDWITAGAMNN